MCNFCLLCGLLIRQGAHLITSKYPPLVDIIKCHFHNSCEVPIKYSGLWCIRDSLYIITGDPLHSRAACTQPCNVNTHSRAHCSPGARLCEQWGHGCVNNGARLCASARLCRGSPVIMTSSNGNIFRVTGHLYGEFTGRWWIPHTKASDAKLWCFLWSVLNKRLSEQWQGWWFETPSCP